MRISRENKQKPKGPKKKFWNMTFNPLFNNLKS